MLRIALRSVGGCAIFWTAMTTAHAGDILRGGAPANQRNPALGNPATSAAADAARSNARDTLSRTTQAIDAVRNMQSAARNLAIKGVNNLGKDPNHPGQMLPIVHDGLRISAAPDPSFNGLNFSKVLPDASGKLGANAPVETKANGRITVSVKQTAQQAFLEWHKFNVGRGTTLYFDQSAGGSAAGQWIAFNQVKDPSGVPSQIMGQIKAQGQVYILNQNGIIFGGTSQINVHALVASSLPINDNLTARGLLNNADNQFLFSALKMDAGTKGTPAFTPPPPPGGKIGDVFVQAGAQLTAPTTAAKVGGRVMLVGPNVTNAGTISTPDGQVIMAAGLQVGVAAHDSNDPSVRGLDVYVGKLIDATVQTFAATTGTVTNRGFIDIQRGNLTMAGKSVQQLGAVSSSTSVSLNGSIILDASYDAVSNVPGNNTNKAPFLFKSSGTVELGPNSVTAILLDSDPAKAVGTKLALASRIDMRGKVIHLGKDALVLAPNATVNINAGVWNFLPSAATPSSSFVRSAGQVYLDSGSMINVAGTTDAMGLLTENITTLALRGSEFADSTLNRNGALRGIDITLDLRRQGVYNGFAWAGTPLADATGFLGIIERSVQQLTTAGGTVNINAGGSVVMAGGSVIDVSGGFTNYDGGMVQTTRVRYGNHIFDIGDATPDRVYDGIYTGQSSFTHSRWGITKTYTTPFMLGKHYEPGYVYGAAGGSINITAPAMALDGTLRGNTVNGPRQRELPAQPSALSLTFAAEQVHSSGAIIPVNPNPPAVFLQSGIAQAAANAFSIDALGNPAELRDDRKKKVVLSPEALKEGGFGFIKVNNPEGSVTLAAGETLETPAMGAVELAARNVNVQGSIISPGGTITLKAYNISPTVAATLAVLDPNDPLRVTPAPKAGQGIVTLGASSVLSTAGYLVDDRLSSPEPGTLPLVLRGGSISIAGYTANLATGSVIDASGGARIDWFGNRTYGDAGSIAIKTGQDLNIAAVLGGSLQLGSTLRGYAGQGSKGGALELQAPFIQIGGSTSNAKTLLLQPDFFNQGGFASFTLTGVGTRGDNSKTPGVFIAPGTVIEPIPQSQIIVPFGGGKDGLVMRNVTYPEGMRSAVSINLNAPTLTETYTPTTAPILVRGDIVMSAGASIQAGVMGNVSMKAGTIALLGNITAPGGTIAIAGANSFPTLAAQTSPLPTVYLGPNASLSTAGKLVLLPDAFGRRTGYVLPGGSISIGGNIVLEAGSKLDVSGASGMLDIAPAYLGLNVDGSPIGNGLISVPLTSGLTTPQFAYATVPTRIDSNGGLISLAGGELLVSQATLLGDAGGPTALGGTLLVSSGRFYVAGVDRLPSDVSLTVTQTGDNVPSVFYSDGRSGIGRPLTGLNGGYFAVNDFLGGGFDSLQLGGNVNFKGPINLTARGSLAVATGGFLFADSTVNLKAEYVALGKAFQAPFQVGEIVQPFTLNGSIYNFAPTSGNGRLNVTAEFIDIGNLTLGGIGNARLIADGGSVRGNGIFSMAGDLYIRSAQVYPTTGSEFTIAVYDPSATDKGSVTFARSGTVSLPMSAGGTLSVYASEINQGGVLRAPFGIINLGWDGTGTAPVNLVVGSKAALPVTSSVTLLSGSITSVSAIDPTTGQGALIPFGRYNPEDGTWIGPNGQNVTVTGMPQKAIHIAGQSIDSRAGSTIDIRGGGDLYAYSWSPGLLGSRDLLGAASASWSTTAQYKAGDLVLYRGQTWSARQGSSGVAPSTGYFWTPLPETYAIIPGYRDMLSPFAAFNTKAASLLSDPGYVSNNLKLGEQIALGAGGGLGEGVYTLLPARYALLPGAFMVTPLSGAPIGSFAKPDGASIVNGFRFSGLNDERSLQPIYSRWEVANSTVLRTRAGYTDFTANKFIADYAALNNISVQRLPQDSGQLVLAAVTAMNLNGSVLAKPIGPGRGGIVDITSASNIIIGDNTTAPAAGSLMLNAAQLSKFGAESLLIGGTRSFNSDGSVSVAVRTNSLTVSNSGAALVGPEIILASNTELHVDDNAIIRQQGTLSGPADTLLLKGDGALLRVTSDFDAQIIRSGVTGPSATVGLVIDAGAKITGTSLTLDSNGLKDAYNKAAIIKGQAITINSGIIRLNFGSSVPGQGLTLGSDLLKQIQSAKSLSLLTYSTLDTYGSGTLGSSNLIDLAIHAAAIRRQNGNASTVVTFQAQNILLDNSANITVADALLTGTKTGTLNFDADKLTLGANRMQIAKFANLGLDASQGLYLGGSGSLDMSGNITVNTPFIVATAKASTQSISAGGTLIFNDVPGATAPSRDSVALGSSIALSGTSVTLGSDIIMPSGIVTVTATNGPLTISGNIDAGGTSRTLYDITRYTNGGIVQLSANGGDVTLASGSIVNVAAPSAGGDAGTLVISVPNGALNLQGTLQGTAGAGGLGGSFQLDVKVLPTLSAIIGTINGGGFNNALAFRVRTSPLVTIDGTTNARDFRLSTDAGAINVTGTIDASGTTGGSIAISAFKGLTLDTDALLDASADKFSNAGKGGSIFLETRGNSGGTLSLNAGSSIDLSVAATATLGDFSGTLHLRAPQTGGGTNLAISPIAGTITGASSIIAEGFKVYDLTATGGLIDATAQANVMADGTTFGANATTIENTLLASNAALKPLFTVRVGAELINTTGDLTLGSNATGTANWDLSSFRFGAAGDKAPGVLTLRAKGDINFYGALSDGFTSAAYNAALLGASSTLPINAQSWSYRITAGADLTATDASQVLAGSALAAGKGNLIIGRFVDSDAPGGAGQSASTSAALVGNYQVIRTGSGDISINAGRDVQLRNQFATIYTAGTQVSNPTLGGTFDVPNPSLAGNAGVLGEPQQTPAYATQYSLGGGNVSVKASGDIGHFKKDIGLSTPGNVVLAPDSNLQMPGTWLYRRGYVDPLTGQFGTSSVGSDVASTTWWIDFSNFFQGVGALGGGNVELIAGGSVHNVDAVVPTNARMTKGTPSAANLVELGGGDVTVRAGKDIDAGVYYVERGRGTLTAGGSITVAKDNLTRATIPGKTTPESMLPTTLFVGKGSFKLDARGDVLLGPIANPFMLPGGINNSIWYKSYFSTYGADSGVEVTSLSGNVTLRGAVVKAASTAASPILLEWYRNVLQYSTDLAVSSSTHPWLRLNETDVSAFAAVTTVGAASLRLTALNGDVNIVGSYNLFPSPTGNLSLEASGAINALRSLGTSVIPGSPAVTKTVWTAGSINLSDASPSLIPGVATPVAYRAFTATNQQKTTASLNFLAALASPFAESGALNSAISTQQVLHSASLLHAGDTEPVRIYAGSGDISGLTLFSPKQTSIVAARDISDVSFYLQNLDSSDVSIISAGRDLLPYNASSALRSQVNQTNTEIAQNEAKALLGDLQLGGPGTLEVLAGHDIRLGNGATNNDGTGSGLLTIGNARNPSLPYDGANIIAAAGIGPAFDLSNSSLDFDAFVASIGSSTGGTTAGSHNYFSELNDPKIKTLADYNKLSAEEQKRIALSLFFLVLRDAGRDHNLVGSPTFGTYTAGISAISTLFPGSFTGNIETNSRDIRTKSGGDIDLVIPGGKLTLQTQQTGSRQVPPGIVTESGGNINIFTDQGVDIGISRIFTLRGGDQVIWASNGDIAAGSSSKTVASAPPTRVIIDPQSGDVKVDLAGLATGGGIGVLATVAGLAPGSVDLIAVNGAIDAGDAGIRATGNLNLAANIVLNAGNISIGGSSAGAPAAPVASAPSLGGVTAASNAAGASSSSAQTNAAAANKATPTAAVNTEDLPSIITVEVIGYGGGGGEDEDEDEELKKKRKL